MEKAECPIYIDAVHKMKAKVDAAKNEKQKLEIMTEFAEKFTMLPVYWSQFTRLAYICKVQLSYENYSFFDSKITSKHVEFHMEQNVSLQLSETSTKKDFKRAEEALKFPHQWLVTIYTRYCHFLTKPRPKGIYELYLKNKELLSKISSCNDDIDKWLECIKEIEDKEAVFANFELKLRQDQNWNNKKIWKSYLKFLKDFDHIEVLETFLKYTRLFISDKEAVEEYRNEIEKFSMWNSPTAKYWMDTIKYEIDFGNLKFAYCLLKRAVKAVLGKNIQIMATTKKLNLIIKMEIYESEMKEIEKLRCLKKEICISPENIISSKIIETKSLNTCLGQNFPFHRSFIGYFLKSANGFVLKKLHATCKLFFAMSKIRLCYRFEVTEKCDTRYHDQSLSFNPNSENCTSHLKNLYIYGSIFCSHVKSRTAMSLLLPKIYCCYVRYLYLRDQDITFDDYKFIVSKYLNQILFVKVNIKEEEKEVKIMEIFNYAEMISEKLRYFESICAKHFISFSFIPKNNISYLMEQRGASYVCEIIYIDGQNIHFDHLSALLRSLNLKSVTLKNIEMKDNAGSSMSNEDLEKFIKSKINSAAKIVVKQSL